MKMPEKRPQFEVTINYKSGISQKFWVTEFERDVNGWHSWTPVDEANKPILLGAENIESVWQTDMNLDAHLANRVNNDY
jgi:hypothetical protein